MSFYNLRSLTPDTFMIAKFDDDFNVEATYTLVRQGFSYTCDCPANNRTVITRPCRHKLMMPTLLPAVDTDRFYDYDTDAFFELLGNLDRPTADLTGREALEDEVMATIDPSYANDGSDPALEGEAPLTKLASVPTPPTIRRR